MRAAIYARYSTDEQREASIDDQYRECERLASSNGFDTIGRFEDKGISAGTTARPGYQDMLSAAREHAFDIIVVEDISRLWRNRAEFGARSAELEDLGVHCVTCVGDDTRRDGWSLIMAIKSALAEHQRKEIAYRTRRGLRGKALSGEPTGGVRVFGYTITGSVHDSESRTVGSIFLKRAAGNSTYSIASGLNNAGILAPRGGRWSQSTITSMLNNERYLGYVVWGKSTWQRSASDSSRKKRVMHPDEAVRRHEPHLQIIDTDLWRRAHGETLV